MTASSRHGDRWWARLAALVLLLFGCFPVANWIRGSLEPDVRRPVEPELLRRYHQALVENGVPDYSLDQCAADYRLAAVLAPARLACAVAMSDGLQAHPGAFWDILLPRYAD